ncbi:Exopolysaccharide phosphotransferase CpsY [Roseobacter fucihabitans]|uniref:Exopolysaccharide phosphotransferase CpsY n=1 Tax=Roseobacter fucihabitans TaxID=1537242 RepID=A0ABZ2BT60_9RHOB|nr:Stealth CR1 domain-containing protein [Roseobacter litoralis]MBC6967103.1 Capsular polysaccharide phosphotransferase SacB [Roseobacter litoralis]
MTQFPANRAEPIDAVITWVNGNSNNHRVKRRSYMADAGEVLHENAINPHRWLCNNEILFCLQSIHNHAPWTRKIWIVVDEETPDLSSLPLELRAKIEFAFHRDLFRDFEEALPTFNSLAIESLIWRIEGLSECFMYFNDDVFLTSPLLPTDMFRGAMPVLRGKWVDYRDLLANTGARDDPAKFNHFMQINAATLMGFDATRLFAAAHVVHPLRRSVMLHLFDAHPQVFANNIRHRFRDLEQFLPQGLHNHACILSGVAVLHEENDHLHIKSGQGNDHTAAQTVDLLLGLPGSEIKFLCVNDLPQLEEIMPEARDWLAQVIGGFSPHPMSDAG